VHIERLSRADPWNTLFLQRHISRLSVEARMTVSFDLRPNSSE
jgi:hypothetical protein